MTADAKVGLLLGLFFIVLIAFLINGFPTFLQSAAAEDVVKTTSLTAPSGPDLVIDHRVTETAQRLAPGIPLRVTEPPQEVIVLDSGRQTPPVAAAAETPVVTPQAPVAIQSFGAVTVPEQVLQVPVPAQPQPQPRKNAVANIREHVVERGDTLASIAQKYYGPEEGNRRAVIQKLYEANKDVLTSPDKVLAGSKLTVPPLQNAEPAKPAPTESLLQRFSNVFERSSQQPQTTRTPVQQPQPNRPAAPKTTEYVVQPGDSLWKIAEKTLGDGKHFETLLDMNKDRLRDADAVVAGMKLVVPVP